MITVVARILCVVARILSFHWRSDVAKMNGSNRKCTSDVLPAYILTVINLMPCKSIKIYV